MQHNELSYWVKIKHKRHFWADKSF